MQHSSRRDSSSCWSSDSISRSNSNDSRCSNGSSSRALRAGCSSTGVNQLRVKGELQHLKTDAEADILPCLSARKYQMHHEKQQLLFRSASRQDSSPKKQQGKRQNDEQQYSEQRNLLLRCFPVSRDSLAVFIVTYMAYASLYSTRKPLSVVKGALNASLGLSAQTLGLMDTSFLGCYAAGQLLLPLLLAAVPQQQFAALTAASFMLSAVATAAFGCSSSGPVLVLLWGFNGLMHAPVFPLLLQYVSSAVTPQQRGAALGLWTTSQQTGISCFCFSCPSSCALLAAQSALFLAHCCSL